MHTNDKDKAANSQDIKLTARIESIEELLRERGFFDSPKPENRASE